MPPSFGLQPLSLDQSWMNPGAYNWGAAQPAVAQAAAPAGMQPFASNPPVPVSGMTPDQLRFQLGQVNAQPNQGFAIANTAIQGLGVLGNLGLGAWSLAQAQEAFNFQKSMATKNYDNAVKNYNSRVEDRAMNRYTPSQQAKADAEIARTRI